MRDLRSAARSYLLHVMMAKGISAGALASEAGISPSTITRFMNSRDHKFNISATTLEKIEKAVKISFAPFLDDITYTSSFDGVGTRSDEYLEKIQASKAIPIIGVVRAGLWRERRSSTEGIIDALNPSSITYCSTFWRREAQFACQVGDSSVSQAAAYGDLLLCVTLDEVIAVDGFLNHGLVIVERQSEDNLIELTARFLVNDFSKFPQVTSELRYYGNETEFPECLSLDSPLARSGQMRILGVVNAVIRRPLGPWPMPHRRAG